jgi:aspartate carbamoyltransferase catalytic subunit
MRTKSIVLCPLPRVDEIDREVDGLPQAAYFEQSADGLFVRAAVLDEVLRP